MTREIADTDLLAEILNVKKMEEGLEEDKQVLGQSMLRVSNMLIEHAVSLKAKSDELLAANCPVYECRICKCKYKLSDIQNHLEKCFGLSHTDALCVAILLSSKHSSRKELTVLPNWPEEPEIPNRNILNEIDLPLNTIPPLAPNEFTKLLLGPNISRTRSPFEWLSDWVSSIKN